MSKFEALRSHLPSLYQPEADEESLVRLFLQATGDSMDIAVQQIMHIMQAHWFSYADKASFDAHAQRERERLGKSVFNVRDVADKLEIDKYPYITDLARLGSIIGVPPWSEPPTHRETVENYRRRIKKIVAIMKNGLGTIEAIRMMTEAELPHALELPRRQRLRSFSIEEAVKKNDVHASISINGIPEDKVGPLMRFKTQTDNSRSPTPTIFIEGIEAEENKTEATVNPIVERFTPLSWALEGIGIGYRGSLDPTEVIRLSPAKRSFIAGTNGLAESSSVTTANLISDPAYNGPWAESAGTPNIHVTAMKQTLDQAIWIAGDGELWRYNGSDWLRVLEAESLSLVHSITEYKQRLYLSTDTGLLSLSAYAENLSAESSSLDGTIGAAKVYDFIESENYASAVDLIACTENGAMPVMVTADNALTVDSPIFDVACYCYYEKAEDFYFGIDGGLIRYEAVHEEWYLFVGEEEYEQEAEWQLVDITDSASWPDTYLPDVTQIAQTADHSLWLASDHGLWRYYAKHQRDLIYKTILEAYPELMPNQINDLHLDERGLLWIATSEGLWRYDGRDLAHYIEEDASWLRQGFADSLYPNQIDPVARGVWRFDRSNERFQSYNYRAKRWADDNSSLVIDAQTAVTAIINTDSVMAHLGTGHGDSFTEATQVPLSDLFMRIKPNESTIVDGGTPAIPRLLKGETTWRYLKLEENPLVIPEDLPWYSSEGRLVLPPDAEERDDIPGRYRNTLVPPDGIFDEVLFAYCPQAKLHLSYCSKEALTVSVRLYRRPSEDAVDPVIVDRVWQGLQRVKPAAIPLTLAVEGQTVRGE